MRGLFSHSFTHSSAYSGMHLRVCICSCKCLPLGSDMCSRERLPGIWSCAWSAWPYQKLHMKLSKDKPHEKLHEKLQQKLDWQTTRSCMRSHIKSCMDSYTQELPPSAVKQPGYVTDTARVSYTYCADTVLYQQVTVLTSECTTQCCHFSITISNMIAVASPQLWA